MLYQIIENGHPYEKGVVYEDKSKAMEVVNNLVALYGNHYYMDKEGMHNYEFALREKTWDEESPEDCCWIEVKRTGEKLCWYFGRYYKIVLNYGNWYLLDNDIMFVFETNGCTYDFLVSDLYSDAFMISHIANRDPKKYDLGNYLKILLELFKKRGYPERINIDDAY